MTCGIYKITRKDTGQCYIGLSEDIEKRWYDHIHCPKLKNSRIDRAIRKHGEDKFDLEIIEELSNDKPLLMKREKHWVAHYNTYKDKNHYNLTPGGDFCPAKLPEIRAKISKANSGDNNPMYGKKHTPESKAKISKAKYGYKHTQETKAKVSKANSGENNPMFGKFGEEHQRFGHKHTLESRKKISKARNTSEYYRVYKQNRKDYKQGFIWVYKYSEDGKRKVISSVDIKKLEEKVKAKGLEWIKFD